MLTGPCKSVQQYSGATLSAGPLLCTHSFVRKLDQTLQISVAVPFSSVIAPCNPALQRWTMQSCMWNQATEVEQLASCDLIFSCLSTTNDVAQVCASVAAARTVTAAPCVWVDCTSGDPSHTQVSYTICLQLLQSGLHRVWLDCEQLPLSLGSF